QNENLLGRSARVRRSCPFLLSSFLWFAGGAKAGSVPRPRAGRGGGPDARLGSPLSGSGGSSRALDARARPPRGISRRPHCEYSWRRAFRGGRHRALSRTFLRLLHGESAGAGRARAIKRRPGSRTSGHLPVSRDAPLFDKRSTSPAHPAMRLEPPSSHNFCTLWGAYGGRAPQARVGVSFRYAIFQPDRPASHRSAPSQAAVRHTALWRGILSRGSHVMRSLPECMPRHFEQQQLDTLPGPGDRSANGFPARAGSSRPEPAAFRHRLLLFPARMGLADLLEPGASLGGARSKRAGRASDSGRQPGPLVTPRLNKIPEKNT